MYLHVSHFLLATNISHCWGPLEVNTHATFQLQNSRAPLEQTPHLLLYSIVSAHCSSPGATILSFVALQHLSRQPQLSWSSSHMHSTVQRASQDNHSSPGAKPHLLLYSIYLGNHSSLGVPHISTLQCSVRLRATTAPLEQNHICCSTAYMYITATTPLELYTH